MLTKIKRKEIICQSVMCALLRAYLGERYFLFTLFLFKSKTRSSSIGFNCFENKLFGNKFHVAQCEQYCLMALKDRIVKIKIKT